MEFKQTTGILSLSPFDRQGIHDLKRAKTFLLDVFLVVGAGPVGLTLAIDLARRGIACRIIDQAPAYPIGTRGRGISLRTQEIFKDLDVLEPLLAYTEPLVPWRYSGQDNKLVREINQASDPGVLPPPHRSILIISQQHTEAVLRERLRRSACTWNWTASLPASPRPLTAWSQKSYEQKEYDQMSQHRFTVLLPQAQLVDTRRNRQRQIA